MTITHIARVCAGCYTMSKKGRVVTITKREDLGGWIAAADWDGWLYTDVVPTLRAAKREAQLMLSETPDHGAA